jgi:phenylalanyl-tRNA synthetase beta chain
MKLSLDWLSEFVTWIEKDPQHIAERLTLSVAEVEDVEVQGALLERCCVGNVLSVAAHPNADTLFLVDVQTDQGRKRVVCGGTNVREDMLVAFAHVGATVRWHGEEVMTLAKVKIRGEASEGMICAAEELGLESVYVVRPEDGERPIVDLSRIAPSEPLRVGASLREALGLQDVVFHVSNTAITHRPDLFSHVGFARECVAIGIATWKKKAAVRYPKFPRNALPFAIANATKNLVPRYCACTLTVDAIPPTPQWMQRRLQATGWRSRGLLIDITNYVMMETGMPLHSFDCEDIKGDVQMRLSKEKERIRTLDDAEHVLPADALVMSDDAGIFDLLGIMGGKRSCTKETTKQVWLHSAVLNAESVRRTIIATGHRTDAATVYEKSVPLSSASIGLMRALELIQELIPSARITSKLHQWGKDSTCTPILLSSDRVCSVLGIALPKKTLLGTLGQVGCIVKQKGKAMMQVTPPPHRETDLHLEEDLIEEVARLVGYENIPEQMPVAPVRTPEREQRHHQLRDVLCTLGYAEVIPLSFVSSKILVELGVREREARRLQNPLSEDYAFLQPSTLSGLLAYAEKNHLEAEGALQAFTLATVFSSAEEHLELGVIRCALEETWIANDPFLLLKRDCDELLSHFGYTLAVAKSQDIPVFAHGGKVAQLFAVGEGAKQNIGKLCEVHPRVRARYGIAHRAAALLIHVPALISLQSTAKKFTEVPRFPVVQYDLTVPRSVTDPLGPTLVAVQKSHPLIQDVAVVDYFTSGAMKKQQYNVTLRCTYGAPDRTLTEEEAKAAHDQVSKKFTKLMS